MFQLFFMEKFDVLSSRYRHVRKMQLHFYLFIQYLKGIIHQSFVSTAPTYGDSRGIAGVRCWTITFFIVPAVPGKHGGYNIGTLTLLGFSVV